MKFLSRFTLPIYWFFCLIPAIVTGQENLSDPHVFHLDSVASLLEAPTTTDSLRVSVLNGLLYYHFGRGELQEALEAAQRMEVVARRYGDQGDIVWSLQGQLVSYGQLQNVEGMRTCYEEIRKIHQNCAGKECMEQLVDTHEIMGIWLSLGGYYKEAVEAFERGLEMGMERSDDRFYEVHKWLAFDYAQIGDYGKSIYVRQQTLEKARENLDTSKLVNSMLGISLIQFKVGDEEDALQSAIESYRLAKEYGKDNKSLLAAAMRLGNLYWRLENYQTSYEYMVETMELIEKAPSDEGFVAAVNIIARDLMQIDPNGQEMKKYLQIADSILAEESWVHGVTDIRDLHNFLSEYYTGRNHELALYHTQQAIDVLAPYAQDTSELYAGALLNYHLNLSRLGEFERAYEAANEQLYYQKVITARNSAKLKAETETEMNLAANERARLLAEQATEHERQNSAQRTKLFGILLAAVVLIMGIIAFFYRRARRDQTTIKKALAEKEVLLREIHHRVKNNLQIISSLLEKQARKSVDEQVRELVREGQTRIQSMALIHHNLYESENVGRINIKNYLNELAHNIQRTQKSDQPVELDFRVENLALDIDSAIPVGLILNELLTNSYKYAFKGVESGKITVDFSHDESSGYQLKVCDNGIGFADAQPQEKPGSIGLNLVRGLVRQLGGKMQWLPTSKGAAVEIQF